MTLYSVKLLIHGKVHDEGAALLDGISGHAGLFGNANDLAKLMPMYLAKGVLWGPTIFIGSGGEAMVILSIQLSIKRNARQRRRI
jgi:CubicO group peptidase (beta-lactamase class C family)